MPRNPDRIAESLLGGRRPIGRDGRSQERRAARRRGADPVAGSGGVQGKGDYRTEEELVEHKTTRNLTYPLAYRDLAKAHDDALAAGRDPAFVVQFLDEAGRTRHAGEWVLMPAHVWEELRGLGEAD